MLDRIVIDWARVINRNRDLLLQNIAALIAMARLRRAGLRPPSRAMFITPCFVFCGLPIPLSDGWRAGMRGGV